MIEEAIIKTKQTGRDECAFSQGQYNDWKEDLYRQLFNHEFWKKYTQCISANLLRESDKDATHLPGLPIK